MHQFAGQTADDKIRFLFKIYDIDGDGLIQHRELQHVMRACMEENGMEFSEEQIDDLTVAMFEDADSENRGAITYEALKHQLEKHGGLLENLTISIDRWLVPPPPPCCESSRRLGRVSSLVSRIAKATPYQLTRPYWRNNYIYLIFLAGFLLVNFILFVTRAHQYATMPGTGPYLILARACGQCLNFDCMFVLVLMLRQSITWLRARGFSAFLPLDHHIYLHKVCGIAIAALGGWHTIMHLLNFSVVVVNHREVNKDNFTTAEWLFTSRPGLFGLVSGWANPTGFLLCIVLSIMVICSQPFVRRRGSFEVFYWTHLLYIPFWILCLLHAPNFWKWFLGPGALYIVERILRLAYMRSERGKTYISSGLLLPSKVTHLVIRRPPHFHFHPGDYVFINIPAIAKYEWHPFTISSAPELDGYMWLHIRAVGEWTNRLYDYFEREQQKLHNGEIAPVYPKGSVPQIGINPQPVVPPKLPAITTCSVRSVTEQNVSASDGDINSKTNGSSYPEIRMNAEKRLQMLLLNQKAPLEKSLSMPDIQTKAKKKERLLALREYMRSESEKSFDECQIRRARLKSLGLAYLSPQNKSLAQSFRYMRNKPTIIAFKTPSLENCEARMSSSSFGSVVGPTERQAEEGTLCPLGDNGPGAIALQPVNYPVGKPLEVRSFNSSYFIFI